MDTSDKSIIFDAEGVCNYCLEANRLLSKYRFSKDEEDKNIENLKNKIKKRKRKNVKYDSILGLSGGVDSSYVAYLAYKMNLKIGEVPLISVDRLFGGESTFRVGKWVHEYLKCYFWGLRLILFKKNKK